MSGLTDSWRVVLDGDFERRHASHVKKISSREQPVLVAVGFATTAEATASTSHLSGSSLPSHTRVHAGEPSPVPVQSKFYPTKINTFDYVQSLVYTSDVTYLSFLSACIMINRICNFLRLDIYCWKDEASLFLQVQCVKKKLVRVQDVSRC
jgi:hypothetical protein